MIQHLESEEETLRELRIGDMEIEIFHHLHTRIDSVVESVVKRKASKKGSFKLLI
jgi:hypothetical protein